MLVLFRTVADPVASADSTISKSSRLRTLQDHLSQELKLEGRPILLQHRFSLVHSSLLDPHKTSSRTFDCSVESREVTKQRATSNKNKSRKRGARRASIRRRQDQQRPAKDVVYQQKKTRPRSECRVKEPLSMSTMSIPGKGRSYSSEEAKTLQRLLGSRNNRDLVTAVNSSSANRTEQSLQTEQASYLEDTYDYLFKRHVNTLNGVIKLHQQQQQQQELVEDENSQQNQQRLPRKQLTIHRLCGNQTEESDIASTRHNSALYSSKSSAVTCEDEQRLRQNSANSTTETTTTHKCQHNNCASSDNNDACASPNSCMCLCDETGDNNNIRGKSCSPEIENNKPSSLHYVQFTKTSKDKSGTAESGISVKVVTSELHELNLEEVEESSGTKKPVITFSHVSTSSGSESSRISSLQSSLSSPARSRSPSPLLEVPVPGPDLDQEMMRPPIN